MCGICGVVSDQSPDPHTLQAMNDALIHRGPDDAGQWVGGHAGLAMRRLSVIDIKGGRQPMTSQNGNLVLVFNGEVYNFKELRSDLEKHGHRFDTASDTEVVLKAFEQFGDDALGKFNGMFALALYDLQRDRLLLARDRLGIKPLHYAIRDGRLAFASELDSLMRSGLVSGKLNPAALDAYLTFLYVPAPDTIFAGASKLRPGEKLIFQKGRLHLELYWQLQFHTSEKWSLDSASEAYRELLADSVRLRTISDVPLGAFLSGGLDSSSVVAMLQAATSTKVKTFTIGFDDAQMDELRYARLAAEHLQTDHTEEILRPDMVKTASQLAAHFGEPFADSSAIPMWLVSQVARRDVTVALSGDGGDELFAGYSWLHMNKKAATYRRVPAVLRHLVDAALRLTPTSPLMTKVRRFSQDSFLSPIDSFRRRQTCFTAAQRASVYTGELAKAIEACAIDRFDEHAQAGAELSQNDWMLHQDSRMYLPDDILTKVDRMSMAVSLEARVPLLDHRLVEFAATVPFALKLSGNKSKVIAKHAMRDILPPELLTQRKQGFAIPIQRWFRQDLREHFKETVLSQESRCNNLLEPKAIADILATHAKGRAHNGHHLWALLMLEHWLRYAETIPGVTLSL